jgi:hypothetical protein
VSLIECFTAMPRRLSRTFWLLGAGVLCVLLSLVAEKPSNAIAVARLGYIVGLLGAAGLVWGAIQVNLVPRAATMLHSSRRRLLGFALVLISIVVGGWLPELNRTTAWVGDWLISTNLLPSDWAREIRSVFAFKLSGATEWTQRLCILAVALLISGSIRWTLCLVGFWFVALAIDTTGEGGFAGWFRIGSAIAWFVGVFMICPRCGAVLQYRRVSRELLDRNWSTSWESRSTPMSATWSDSNGRTRSTMSGSGTQWIPVTRTQSTYRDTYSCKRCSYLRAKTVSEFK